MRFRFARAALFAAGMLVSGCAGGSPAIQPALLPASAPPVTIAPGMAEIVFETSAPVDLANVEYLVAINTSGNGAQPYYGTGFANWSYAFVVGGSSGYDMRPGLLQVQTFPATGIAQTSAVPLPAGALAFSPVLPAPADGRYGFALAFDRCILDRPPSGIPPAGPSSCPPPRYSSTTWNISVFTLDGHVPLDSLGAGGPFDTSYRFTVDTTRTVNARYFRAPNPTVPNAAARVVGLEFDGTP